MAFSSPSLERSTRMTHSPDVHPIVDFLAVDPVTRAPLASAHTRERLDEIMRDTRPDTPFDVLPE
jgi:hypothetical protein